MGLEAVDYFLVIKRKNGELIYLLNGEVTKKDVAIDIKTVLDALKLVIT